MKNVFNLESGEAGALYTVVKLELDGNWLVVHLRATWHSEEKPCLLTKEVQFRVKQEDTTKWYLGRMFGVVAYPHDRDEYWVKKD